jgi:hypothetical protein
MVLMHLAHKKKEPVVSHNLILVQGSPVPMLKFQMALQTLNILWVQERGAQIYTSE